jgi:hypothetical protein
MDLPFALNILLANIVTILHILKWALTFHH